MAADTSDLDASRALLSERGARIADVFEGERERFFLWSPVCLGLGIAAYFAMPAEPQLSVAFAPLALALIFRAVSARGTITSTVLTSLILVGAGFVIAKVRVEAVRAPVLAKSLHNAEITGVVTLVEFRSPKGQRLTISATEIAGIAPDKTPAVVHVRTMAAHSNAQPGDRVRLKATLHHRQSPRYPMGSITQGRRGSIRLARSATPSRRRSLKAASMPERGCSVIGVGWKIFAKPSRCAFGQRCPVKRARSHWR